MRLEREYHVSELGGVGRSHREVNDEIGVLEGASPAVGVGEITQRINPVENDRPDVTRFESGPDRLDVPAGFDFCQTRAGVGQATDLAETAGIGDLGDLDQSGLFLACEP